MSSTSNNQCPVYSPILGALGLGFSISLSAIGAAYGTAKSGKGVMAVGTLHPELIIRFILPIIMAGVVAMFGLIVDMFMLNGFVKGSYPLFTGALHLGAGLCMGFCGLASGVAIGVVGDAAVRGVAQQPRLFIGMILILIFSEVLALYGMIVALFICQKASADLKC